MRIAHQIIRFISVGVVNTAIDFAVFNSLIYAFGLNNPRYFIYKALAFTAAVINSYMLNRHWVFKSQKRSKNLVREQASFALVSSVGLGINVITSLAVFHLLSTNFHAFPTIVDANIGAVAGTLAVLSWNFLGYKFFVFKERS